MENESGQLVPSDAKPSEQDSTEPVSLSQVQNEEPALSDHRVINVDGVFHLRPPRLLPQLMASETSIAQRDLSFNPTLENQDTLILQEEAIFEIIGEFFSRKHRLLPSIHRASFVSRVENGEETMRNSPLLCIVLGVTIIAMDWHGGSHFGYLLFMRAKELLKLRFDQQEGKIHTCQAAVWVIFMHFILADFSEAHLFLSKALKYAECFTLVDHPQDLLDETAALTSIELEEVRKTMWALYVLDRSVFCLLSLPMAVKESQFGVNFPMEDELFQSSSSFDLNNIGNDPNPFTGEIDVRCIKEGASSVPKIRHIYHASVLLGQIVSLHKPPCASKHSDDSIFKFIKMGNMLSSIETAFSYFSNSWQDMDENDAIMTLWLRTLLQSCKILLFHPRVADNDLPNYGRVGEFVNNAGAFEKCYEAMKFIIQDVKMLLILNEDAAFKNPFLLNAVFLCFRFRLVLKSLEGADEDEDNGGNSGMDGLAAGVTADTEDVTCVFMMLSDVLETMKKAGFPVAQAFNLELIKDSKSSPEEVKAMRTGKGFYFD